MRLCAPPFLVALLGAAAAAAGAPAPPLPVSLASRRGCTVSLRVAASALAPRTALVGLRNAKEVVLEHWPPAGAGAGAGNVFTEVALEMRASELFVYLLELGGEAAAASLLGTLALPACDDVAQLPPRRDAASGGPVVSLLYEAWQAYAANASATIAAMGGERLSVEAVMRSNGSLVLADIWDRYNVTALTQGFFWQEEPLLGFYCIYRKRWNEATGVLPDCLNISGTTSQQASWFASSGVDFVTADGTNLCTPSPFADAIQTRPMEVLFEEFSALRAQGFTTPAIAAWQRAVTGCTLHTQILGIYNNATFNKLVYRDPASGKMVFFVPDGPDPAIVAEIESNGGRNDVLVQEMWALFVNSTAPGRWAFESPCTVQLPGGGFGFTTSVVGRGRGASGCGQLETEGSALGSAIAVSPSYQESYGSVPFSASNKYEGLVFKRQFGTVFDNAARRLEDGSKPRASALVDNIYLSSWNEYLSQPQVNPWGSDAYAYSMGIPWDAQGRSSLWVDTWGQSISRDIEPSVHGGSLNFDIMSSCLRVARLMSHVVRADERVPRARDVARMFGARAGGRASAAACAVAGELCCAFDEAQDGYAAVSALVAGDGSDALVTLDPAEVARLTGQGWVETCNGYGGPTDFCVENTGAFLRSPRAVQGPFALHSGGCGLPGGGGDPVLPGRRPVVRCFDPQAKLHFVAGAAACPGGAQLEAAVGCAAAERSSNMPRELHACTASAAHGGRRYHALDAPCEDGDADDAGVLGYVH